MTKCASVFCFFARFPWGFVPVKLISLSFESFKVSGGVSKASGLLSASLYEAVTGFMGDASIDSGRMPHWARGLVSLGVCGIARSPNSEAVCRVSLVAEHSILDR